MPLSLLEFLCQTLGSPALLTCTLLTLGVLLVNGWTDAPNAIAGAVVTGALPFRGAVALAAVCNFLGVFCVTAVNASVAETIYSIASFGGGTRAALITLCAAMSAIILWATAAWLFGIPTSESHALVAGISGAAVALEGGFSCIHWGSWGKILLGLVLSVAVGFLTGRICIRWVQTLRWKSGTMRLLQIPGAACTAFLHGAQDGQKFLGVFILTAALSQGRQDEGTFLVPVWLMALCAIAMALGTSLGGRRIIEKVALQMVDLGPREGFAGDVAGCLCLFSATALGLPVSTTHTRTAALLGVGSHNGGRVDRAVARSILLAWIVTFPGCFAIGYSMAKLFLFVFL